MITIHQEKETDFTKNGYGTLDDYIINPEVSWEMNGEFMLNFDYPVFAPYSKYLTDENIVRAPVPYMDDQLFRIYRPIPRLGYIQVTAKHIFYDLNDNFVEDTNVVGKNGLGALNQILNATQYPHRFNAFSDIDTVGNARIVRYNPVEALLDDSKDNTFINRWGGEVYRDNFNIHMRKRLGSNRGVRIEHKKDLTGFESEMDFSTVITRIMPKGFDGLLLPEKYVDSPLLDPDRPKIRVVEYSEVKAAVGEYANDEDAIPLEAAYAELRRLASREYSINHVDEPETVIHVDFVTLENTKEYEDFKELQTIHQGDTVRVSVPEQDIEINSRLVAFKSNPLLENHYTSTTLGNHVLEYTTSRTEIDVIRKEIKNTNELITITRQAANGKNSNFWGTVDPNTLELNAQIDDTYFHEDGDYFAIWEYVEVNGERYWRKGPNTDFGKEIANQLKNAIEDIEIAQETADEAVDEINTAVSNAGFTSLSDSLTGIQSIANSAQNNSVTAVANAQTALTQSIDALGDASLALTNSQTAINTADSAISSIQDINVEIDKINGMLAIKADSSTVNVIDGTVSNLSTEVGIIAGELSLKADSQVVDTLVGTVESHGTQIQANAGAISLKADQSTVNALAGTVSTLGTDIGVVAGQISSKVWSTDIQTAVDGIEVGGRNLLLNTNQEHGLTATREYMSLPYDLTPIFNEYGLDQEYTMSFDLKSKNISNVDWINIYPNPGTTPPNRHAFRSRQFKVTTEYQRFSMTFKPTDSNKDKTTTYISVYGQYGSGNFPVLRNIKLELGNKATDWTPAPEDTTAFINHVETTLTQKHDAIEATVSSVRTDLDGTTTLLNTTRTTVSGHTSSISTLRTDVNGKATTAQFNTLNSTVNGTIQRVGTAEGKITTIETNVSGLQTTVAGKAAQSQVTQLANGLSAVVSKTDQISEWIRSYRVRTANPTELLDINGSRLSKEHSYEIILGVTGTGTVTNFIASLTSNSAANGWTLTIHERSDTISNHPYVYLNSSGNPMVSLYNHATYYNVVATVKKLASRSKTSLTVLSDNINLRVQKGDVVSQLNIDANRTLISSSKILLNANTVSISGTAWMSGAVITDLSVTNAKIADGTISSAKIASLDAGKISTGTLDGIAIKGVTITGSTFIQESSVSGSTYGRWDRKGLRLQDRDRTLVMEMSREGISFSGSDTILERGTWINNNMLSVGNGYIYNLFVTGETAQLNNARFRGTVTIGNTDTGQGHGIRFRGQTVPAAAENTIWAGYGSGGYGIYHYYEGGWQKMQTALGSISSLSINQLTTNTLNVASPLTLNHRLLLQNAGLQFTGGSLPSVVDRQMWIGYGYSDTGIYVSMNGNWYKHGATISDARLKENIVDTEIDSLSAIASWNFVEFEWKNREYGSGQQFGLIAQSTSHIANYYDEVDRWEINGDKQTMMNSHAIQQLALMETNTNAVASQALLLGESNKSEIDELREENKEFRNRIEELESVA